MIYFLLVFHYFPFELGPPLLEHIISPGNILEMARIKRFHLGDCFVLNSPFIFRVIVTELWLQLLSRVSREDGFSFYSVFVSIVLGVYIWSFLCLVQTAALLFFYFFYFIFQQTNNLTFMVYVVQYLSLIFLYLQLENAPTDIHAAGF